MQGVRIGFIGMTLEGTPDIVSSPGSPDLEFRDEAETANRYAARAAAQGVQAIVVLLHEGGTQAAAAGSTTASASPARSSDIAHRYRPTPIDVVVSGHTHQAYNCVLDGKVVTSASSFGRLVTDIDLTDRPGDRRRASHARAHNVVVARDVAPDPAQTRADRPLPDAARPGRDPAGRARPARRSPAPGGAASARRPGESPLGNLIADAQLAATDDEQGAVAAFMNPGGVRADLDAGPVTYEEAFTVQPFGNNLTTLDLTGAQLDCLLEQQFVTERTLQPSAHGALHRATRPAPPAPPPTRAPARGWPTSLTIGGAAGRPCRHATGSR